MLHESITSTSTYSGGVSVGRMTKRHTLSRMLRRGAARLGTTGAMRTGPTAAAGARFGRGSNAPGIMRGNLNMS